LTDYLRFMVMGSTFRWGSLEDKIWVMKRNQNNATQAHFHRSWIVWSFRDLYVDNDFSTIISPKLWKVSWRKETWELALQLPTYN